MSDSFSNLMITVAHTSMYAAHLEAERMWLYGNGTSEPLGFLGPALLREPTPAERAFAILAPHLAHVSLYRPALTGASYWPDTGASRTLR